MSNHARAAVAFRCRLVPPTTLKALCALVAVALGGIAMTDPVDTEALRKMTWRNGRRATVVTLNSDLIESAAEEVDRLRAVIENAPHDLTKQHAWHGLDMTLCRCWKADAL